MTKERAVLAATVGLLLVVVTSSLWRYARAGGIPATGAMYYSGSLTHEDGTPLDIAPSLDISFWDAATAGAQLCSFTATDLVLTGGRFRVPLPDSCTEAVADVPDVWTQISLGDLDGGATVFTRTKLGAVPYAVEARHATEATEVTGPTVHAAYRVNPMDPVQHFRETGSRTVRYGQREEDTHLAVVVDPSWQFVAPSAGLYLVQATLALSFDSGFGGNSVLTLQARTPAGAVVLDRNGPSGTLQPAGGSYLHIDGPLSVSGTAVVRLAAGDAVSVELLAANANEPNVDFVSPGNRVTVTRLGP